MQNRVSVAVCTCDGAGFLRQQLDSIGSQSHLPTEIVIVDDASADSTADVARQFAALSAVRTSIFGNSSRLGVAANFARALSLCRGDVIFLADQDDLWEPRKVERLLAVFDADPNVALVHSDAHVVDADLIDTGGLLSGALRLTAREVAPATAGAQFDVLLRRNVVTGCTAAIRADLLRIALPIPPNWLHDEWLAIIAAAVGEIRWIDEPLVLYRQHADNNLGVTRHRLFRKLRALWAGRDGVRDQFIPRLAQLLARLEALGPVVRPGAVERVRAALAFAQFRAALPPSRIRRLPAIAARLLSGEYHDYGRGFLTALVDAVETIPASRSDSNPSPSIPL